MPRPIRLSRKALVTDTTAFALRYRNSSTFSSQSSAFDSFIAPTARIDSGHRSRSSNTHGTRFIRLTAYAAHAVKNCGDVPTTRSTPRTKGLASTADSMKLW